VADDERDSVRRRDAAVVGGVAVAVWGAVVFALPLRVASALAERTVSVDLVPEHSSVRAKRRVRQTTMLAAILPLWAFLQ